MHACSAGRLHLQNMPEIINSLLLHELLCQIVHESDFLHAAGHAVRSEESCLNLLWPSAVQASAQDPVVPEAASATKIMSHVLRLANMVTRQELADEEEYDDIVDDIREEIEDKYGTLRSVIVPKPASAGPPADPPGVGLVFVDFQDQAAAQKAQSVLNGRMFADRTVQASFFDQAAFNAQQLS